MPNNGVIDENWARQMAREILEQGDFATNYPLTAQIVSDLLALADRQAINYEAFNGIEYQPVMDCSGCSCTTRAERPNELDQAGKDLHFEIIEGYWNGHLIEQAKTGDSLTIKFRIKFYDDFFLTDYRSGVGKPWFRTTTTWTLESKHGTAEATQTTTSLGVSTPLCNLNWQLTTEDTITVTIVQENDNSFGVDNKSYTDDVTLWHFFANNGALLTNPVSVSRPSC